MKVSQIYEELKSRYVTSGEMETLLEGSSVAALSGFLDNDNMIEQFNSVYYGETQPKIALCGINPGKFGAGKTGIPFLDFTSLSQMLDGVNENGTERSAKFFFDVVQEIGASRFYSNFYVTNVSWLGYIENNNNLNYYDLPDAAKVFVLRMFKFEINELKVDTIVSLSGEVKKTVDTLFCDSDIDTSYQLPHPNYCAFPNNYEEGKRKYIELLNSFL